MHADFITVITAEAPVSAPGRDVTWRPDALGGENQIDYPTPATLRQNTHRPVSYEILIMPREKINTNVSF